MYHCYQVLRSEKECAKHGLSYDAARGQSRSPMSNSDPTSLKALCRSVSIGVASLWRNLYAVACRSGSIM